MGCSEGGEVRASVGNPFLPALGVLIGKDIAEERSRGDVERSKISTEFVGGGVGSGMTFTSSSPDFSMSEVVVIALLEGARPFGVAGPAEEG